MGISCDGRDVEVVRVLHRSSLEWSNSGDRDLLEMACIRSHGLLNILTPDHITPGLDAGIRVRFPDRLKV